MNQQSMAVYDTESKSYFTDELLDIKSSSLVQAFKVTFEKAGLTLKDIDLLAVSVGPGSFTGIRNSLTIVRTLALELDLRIFTCNNFQLMRFLKPELATVVLPATSNSYYISKSNNDFESPNLHYFSFDNPLETVHDLNDQRIAKLIIEYYLNQQQPKTIASYELKPYYLREPSVGKIKKTLKSA